MASGENRGDFYGSFVLGYHIFYFFFYFLHGKKNICL